MTLECTPRRISFKNGYIGLFWASYIHQPESNSIHFLGHPERGEPPHRWIEPTSPRHGERATHLAADDRRDFTQDPDFPLTLVSNRYDEPWYFGASHGRAYAQVFRPRDRSLPAQSPSGVARETQPGIFRLLSRTTKWGAATLWSCERST